MNPNQTLIIAIIGIILFFVFILPMIEKQYEKEIQKFTDLNDFSILPIDQTKRDEQCCFTNFTQWPVPKNLIEKTKMTEDELKKYVPTNFSSGSKCLCITQDQVDYLVKRGGNKNI